MCRRRCERAGPVSVLVHTLVEALDRPSTLKALARKTGYPVSRIMGIIRRARAEGVTIRAVARGQYSETQPTIYMIVSEVTDGR